MVMVVGQWAKVYDYMYKSLKWRFSEESRNWCHLFRCVVLRLACLVRSNGYFFVWKSQFGYCGHVIRNPQERIATGVLQTGPTDRRPTMRPIDWMMISVDTDNRGTWISDQCVRIMIIRLRFRFQDWAMRCVLVHKTSFHVAPPVHSAGKKEKSFVGLLSRP